MPPAHSVFHNWRLKLSALGLSLFLWAVVQSEPGNRETFSSVPVRVEISDTSWVLAGPAQPTVVEVRLGGSAREIIRLAREGTTLRVPVTSVGSRDTVVSVRREWVEAAQRAGITVESVVPAALQLSFEPAVTRMVPVAARIQGNVRGGVALVGDVTASPQFVRVRGPESRVAGLDSIRLQPFDLATVSQSGIFTVAVDTSGLVGGSVVPSTVALGVRVEELVERILPGVVVEIETVPGQPRLVVEPGVVQVRLVGARSLVTGLATSEITASVGREMLLGMTTGEVRRVPVRITGVPARVTAETVEDGVEVRRAADVDGEDSGGGG